MMEQFEVNREVNSKGCNVKSFQTAISEIDGAYKKKMAGEKYTESSDSEQEMSESASSLAKCVDQEVTDSLPEELDSTGGDIFTFPKQKTYSRNPSKKPLGITKPNSPIKIRKRNLEVSIDECQMVTSPRKRRTIVPPTVFTKSSNRKKMNNYESSGLGNYHVADLPSTEKPLLISSITPIMDCKFGFLGLGTMGSRIAQQLLQSGHDLTTWNRSAGKSKEVVELGGHEAQSPHDMLSSCNVVFSCVSDSYAAQEVMFGRNGVLEGITEGKGFVELSTIDGDTSYQLSQAVQGKKGRYLEAPLIGSKLEAEEGTLVILCAGDRSLYDDCKSCFQSAAKKSYYLGPVVGQASRMKLVFACLEGSVLSSLAETMALANRCHVNTDHVLDIIQMTKLNSTLIQEKGKMIKEGKFPPDCMLKHAQKDMRLVVGQGDEYSQSLPMASSVNEMMKRGITLGNENKDVVSVYKAMAL